MEEATEEEERNEETVEVPQEEADAEGQNDLDKHTEQEKLPNGIEDDDESEGEENGNDEEVKQINENGEDIIKDFGYIIGLDSITYHADRNPSRSRARLGQSGSVTIVTTRKRIVSPSPTHVWSCLSPSTSPFGDQGPSYSYIYETRFRTERLQQSLQVGYSDKL